jgi:hypothetical protein
MQRGTKGRTEFNLDRNQFQAVVKSDTRIKSGSQVDMDLGQAKLEANLKLNPKK